MAASTDQISRATDLGNKITKLLGRRLQAAQQHFVERLGEAWRNEVAQAPTDPWSLMEAAWSWPTYFVDAAERWTLFWDTLRERGNAFLERERTGKPPVLHFKYTIVLDARQFERPVNYALVQIVPPAGVTIDPKKRPYVIIDPRAGHGPGIGGFKDDSQAGVALRAGHPVYFVIFFPEPQPGQTLMDVCAAEQVFIRKVRALHPDSPKPTIIGNCQGGWAVMMLAASSPDDTGPIVINGAPMSYWGGAWTEGEGNNPMRYAGGILGGSWLASLTADLGNGLFDGAYLVQNFEYLNPANTYWNKYYQIFANADTEPPRFLDFERWWGGFYLLNREEIEWIVQNLFVGNQVWASGTNQSSFDLRKLRTPIILFASMGDNITPPQQAFNWVADIYGSTEEIKARGQVIVGLLHPDAGHLGIFVSGKVAKKEYTQIVSVMESIEALPPGLYGMKIDEERDPNGKVTYKVTFIEHELEEIAARLNRFERRDERVFEAVADVSELNQRLYEQFLRPTVQRMSNELTARIGRAMHPLRLERWIWSDLNPWVAWLRPAAAAVRSRRHAVAPEQPLRRTEKLGADAISAALDYYRDVRDAVSEAMFFLTFGALLNVHLPERAEVAAGTKPTGKVGGRELPIVREALASLAEGGYAEAVSRAGYLLARKGRPLPLARLQVTAALQREYANLLPRLQPDERRRILGMQEIICRYEPEQALETLPLLLRSPDDRQRFRTLLDTLLADPRFVPEDVTPEQRTMLGRIQAIIGGNGEVAAALPSGPADASSANAAPAHRRHNGHRQRLNPNAKRKVSTP